MKITDHKINGYNPAVALVVVEENGISAMGMASANEPILALRLAKMRARHRLPKSAKISISGEVIEVEK